MFNNDRKAMAYLEKNEVSSLDNIKDIIERIPPSCLGMYGETDIQRAANYFASKKNRILNGEELVTQGRMFLVESLKNSLELQPGRFFSILKLEREDMFRAVVIGYKTTLEVSKKELLSNIEDRTISVASYTGSSSSKINYEIDGTFKEAVLQLGELYKAAGRKDMDFPKDLKSLVDTTIEDKSLSFSDKIIVFAKMVEEDIDLKNTVITRLKDLTSAEDRSSKLDTGALVLVKKDYKGLKEGMCAFLYQDNESEEVLLTECSDLYFSNGREWRRYFAGLALPIIALTAPMSAGATIALAAAGVVITKRTDDVNTKELRVTKDRDTVTLTKDELKECYNLGYLKSITETSDRFNTALGK